MNQLSKAAAVLGRKGGQVTGDCKKRSHHVISLGLKKAWAKKLGEWPERLWKRMKRESFIRPGQSTECWIWTGCKLPDGYGNVLYNGRYTLTHRLAWEFTNGPIPNGKKCLHKCDNPPCGNPAHLFLGTQNDNVQDMIQKGRDRKRNGHDVNTSKLTAEQVLEIRKTHESGKSQRFLARMFGVAKPSIACIIHRKTWKHI